MSWTRAVEGVADKLRADAVPTPVLETLAREIPITGETDENRTAVGVALERVLGERYRAEWAGRSDAEVFAAGTDYPGEQYRDRVDRARSDVMHALLEERHPELGDPGDSFLFHPEGTVAEWRAHLRLFYGIAS